MRKLLKLQEHKHTAKKLPHHHTSYRGLWIVMVAFGVALVLVQKAAGAQSYNVTATVPAPIPSTPAKITSVENNSQTTNANIVISGNCPIIVPSIIVALYRNGEFVCSSGCNSSGKFYATVHLIEGNNVFIPRIFTITNGEGPPGEPVNITYVLGTNTGSSAAKNIQSNGQQTFTAEPLKIEIDNPFMTYKPDEDSTLEFKISGGKPPYTAKIEWGDGKYSNYSLSKEGSQSLKHTYKVNKTYLIKITIKDNSNQLAVSSLAAITFVNNKTPSVFGAIQSVEPTNYLTDFKNLIVIYGSIILVILAFWFGSRKELQIIAKNTKHKSRR